MATILLSLSSKEDKITHRSEVLLRFLPFHGVNLRSKTGVFIYPRHFRYFVNRTASQKAGVVIPENITSITQQEVKKNGAAYKVVKDPNIVGKMSGHVEGSRAFNRYRQIDDDILRETINEI
jgi:hypothetical protein